MGSRKFNFYKANSSIFFTFQIKERGETDKNIFQAESVKRGEAFFKSN